MNSFHSLIWRNFYAKSIFSAFTIQFFLDYYPVGTKIWKESSIFKMSRRLILHSNNDEKLLKNFNKQFKNFIRWKLYIEIFFFFFQLDRKS